ncbi:trehalose-phosphatase [Streptomonospora sp. S1-112]|uniref:Trehalose 6-phosphate phosphatase n=1 Tax=Streptomonospora mangrovi TaxID=2883123 RepID=A0A9X3P0N8_9ACTN|nr:trehalose-phosphatase [Streptomonospora mangrovi]MDA0567741.1 trehalose-phosphatase [Streptomonospora mangrovi]
MPLPEPRSAKGATALERIVRYPAEAVLSFDFDGTLAPIVSDPRDARAYPGVTAELQRLAPLVGRLVIITGRPAEVAVEYGALDSVENILVLGHYGLERWEDGRVTAPGTPPGVALVREELPGLLRKAQAPEGVAIEDKGRSLAVHTRRAPDPDSALDALRVPLAALAQRAGLTVEPGRRVIELRPDGMDKGAALNLTVADHRGEHTAVLYAGDDLGDLPAFDAVDRLAAEGTPGITVCSGSDEVATLAERADLVVDGPPGVAGLLTALREEITAAAG